MNGPDRTTNDSRPGMAGIATEYLVTAVVKPLDSEYRQTGEPT
jgi:hypothetical protein